MKKITSSIIIAIGILILGAAVAGAQEGTWERIDPRAEIDGYPDSPLCEITEPPPEQPDEEPELEECCTYCVRFRDDGLYTCGSVSCAGCNNCERPTGFGMLDIAAWVQWLGCQIYFKAACPILCFFSAWLDAILQWLKSWLAWLPDLAAQIIAIIIMILMFILGVLALIVDLVTLIAKITGQVMGALGEIVSGIFNVTPETVTLPAEDSDWGLLYCVLGEFDWAVRNSLMILWFVNVVIHIVAANVWWTLKYWTSGDETTERPAQETEVR